MEEFNYTQEQLALAIGKGRTTITETLSLNKLPEEIKKECRDAGIYSKRTLIEIAKQKTNEERTAIFKKVKEGNLKSDQVRKIARKQAKRKQRNTMTIALERSLSLSQCLGKVDLSGEESKEKVRLITELKNLRKLIDKLIG